MCCRSKIKASHTGWGIRKVFTKISLIPFLIVFLRCFIPVIIFCCFLHVFKQKNFQKYFIADSICYFYYFYKTAFCPISLDINCVLNRSLSAIMISYIFIFITGNRSPLDRLSDGSCIIWVLERNQIIRTNVH